MKKENRIKLSNVTVRRMKAMFFVLLLMVALYPTIISNVGAIQGGPDVFGYIWVDSKAPTPSIDYNWIEINATGTDSSVTGDDNFGGPFPLGFSFNFYGNSYNELYFNTNSLITFRSGSGSLGNTPIPSVSTPDNFIAPFWDDLAVGSVYNTGIIYYEELGIAPNRQFVVEWWNITTLGGMGPMTFEVILNETGEIWIQYQTLGTADSSSATVGIENIDGTDGLEYSYDTLGAITDNLAIMFALPYGISLTPEVSTRFGDLSTIVNYNLTVDNIGSNSDTYDLTISGNSWATEIYDATGTILISSISINADSNDNITVKVSIPGSANPGDFDNVTITTTSQNDTAVNDSASLNTTYLLVPSYVAVIQDANPWGFTSIQDVLTLHSIPFDVYTSADIGMVDLSPYDKVIIPSDQPQSYYDTVEANLGWFESYVISGGILQFSAGSNGWNGGSWVNVPGGYSKVYQTDDSVSISIPTHQFVTVPNIITDAELDGWSSSTHAYFSALPMGAVTVCTDSNGPCVVESVSGLGRYFAYGLIVEWGWGQGYSRMLENIILCMNGTATMPTYAVNITPESQIGYNSPGADADYIITARNIGINNDTYDLSFTSLWPLTFRDIGDTMDIISIFVSSGNTVDFIARMSIPGGASPGDIDSAIITATSQNDTGEWDNVSIKTQVPYSVAWLDSFETGWGPWSTEIISASNPNPTYWEMGDPMGFGPGSAYNGTNCSGTNLLDDYYTGADITLQTPFIQLSSAPQRLSFYTWYDMNTNGDDGGFVEISVNGGAWSQIWPSGNYPYLGGYMGGYWTDGFSGTSSGWEYYEFDLGVYGNQVVQIRFHFAASGMWGWQWGWYLDEIYIGPPPPYEMDLMPDDQRYYSSPGASVDYILTVDNTGSSDDTYDLSVSGNVWPVIFRNIGDTMDITSLFGSAQTSQDFIARVSIPGGAMPGELDSAIINAASQNDSGVWDNGLTSTQVPHSPGWLDGFESGWGAWSTEVLSESNPTSTHWEIGDPLGSGPNTAYNGLNCSGTNIVGFYYPSADITMMTPYIQLGSGAQILSFYTWYYMSTNGEDGGFVEISVNGGAWLQIWPTINYPWLGGFMGGYWTDGFSGISSGWEYHEFDLSAYSDQVVQVRFHFSASDWWGWQWGWYTDEVYMGPPPPYRFELLPDYNQTFGSAGISQDYVLCIYNNGTENDTYDLMSMSIWPVIFRDIGDTLDITSIVVNSGEIGYFIVRVSIPGGASPGDFDIVNITAVSQGDPLIWDITTIKTIVIFTTPWYDDLESGLGFWSLWDDGGGTIWELGDPAGGVGPSNAQSPSNCFGTNLMVDYVLPSVSILTTPPVDLGAIPNPILTFEHWYYIDGVPVSGDVEDGGAVEISTDGGSTWTYIVPVGGYPEQAESGHPWPSPDCYAGDSGGWVSAEFDLSAYAGQVVMARFYFWTETWVESGYPGWYIDDIYMGAPSPYSFELLSQYNVSGGLAGGTVDYVLTINNTGSSDDTYDLLSTSIWPVVFRDIADTMDITSIFVASASMEDLIARVSIPGGATPGDYDIADIRATSQGDPFEWCNISLITFIPFNPPWFEDFEIGSIGGSTGINWSATDLNFAGVDTYTSQSGIYSLYTSGGFVVVTSFPVYMAGLAQGEVRCWIQRGDDLFSEDPDIGEDLIIEYRNNLGLWVWLDTYNGDGTSGQIYTPIYTLPGDALHSAFQLRFTQTGGTGLGMDYWHIDDVYIGAPLGDITPPADITDLTVFSTTETTVTLTWTAPGDDGMFGTATAYEIRYSNTGSITDANWASATLYSQFWPPLSGGSFEMHDVTGLSPGTQYWFAIKTVDEVPNWSGISNSPSGITAIDVTPPSDITDLAVIGTSSNAVTLTWTAPGDDGMTGAATAYEVRYSASGPINDGNWASATLFSQFWTPLIAGNTETRDVSGLSSGTQYWFGIRARDEVPNWSGASNSPSGTTTLGDSTSPQIFNMMVDGQTSVTVSSGATVTLTATIDDSSTGNSVIGGANYTIGFQNWPGINMIPFDGAFNAVSEVVTTNVDTTGWAEGSYDLYVYCWDVIPNYKTAPTSFATIVIDSTSPGNIIDLTVVGTECNQVTLTWTAPGDDGMSGTATSYEVRYSDTGPIDDTNWDTASLYSQSWIPQVAGNTETYNVTGLNANTQYRFAIKTSDEVPNWSGTSNSVSGITLVDNLAPLISNVLVNGGTSIAVNDGTDVTLTATISDTLMGNSNIGGANWTLESQSWPGTDMNPTDGGFDEPTESVRITIDTSGWSNGAHRVYVYGWDETPNHNTASSEYATIIIDGTPPTSSVDTISQYWHSTTSLTITATASDIGSGLANVELMYRYSSDDIYWSNWISAGTDIESPWEWTFNFPSGNGYYEFKSIATDSATNVETDSGTDAICGYDTESPTSTLDTISPYWRTSSPLTITSTAIDTVSGLATIELFYRFSVDNSTWSSWVSYASDLQTPWEWSFSFPEGEGYYEFYTMATDVATNEETGTIKENICGYDATPPSADAGSNQNVFVGAEVNFDGSDSYDNLKLETYTWTFNDGIERTLDGVSPSYTFNTAGNYQVTLSVTDSVGNWDTDTVWINVEQIITTGSISGVIRDENGNPIEGATITVEGTTLMAKTNETGHYTIPNLPAGSYDLTVTKSSYDSQTISDVSVAGGQDTQNGAIALKKSKEEEPESYLWLFIIIIVVVVVLLLLLLVKPKKKRPEDLEGYQSQQHTTVPPGSPQVIEHRNSNQPPYHGPNQYPPQTLSQEPPQTIEDGESNLPTEPEQLQTLLQEPPQTAGDEESSLPTEPEQPELPPEAEPEPQQPQTPPQEPPQTIGHEESNLTPEPELQNSQTPSPEPSETIEHKEPSLSTKPESKPKQAKAPSRKTPKSVKQKAHHRAPSPQSKSSKTPTRGKAHDPKRALPPPPPP